MMQMLHRGGLPAITDGIRESDRDNPHGYFEFEPVKKTKEDPSWVPGARGKVVKMVSSLLYDLPTNESYRIIFMERELDEVLASQEKMLKRLNRPVAPTDKMKASYQIHLKRLFEWLPNQRQMQILLVNFNRLLQNPETEAGLISQFLHGKPLVDDMLGAIDPSLYRNRAAREAKASP
jgi:uncharacterized coiled-coil protein SlyX